jgi:FtsP/CotA-like multicopper oxidase with cupredoxin domain
VQHASQRILPKLKSVRLMPGERAEVLVDFGKGSPLTLLSGPHQETSNG